MLTLLSLTTFVHPPKFHTSPLKKWPFFKRKGVFQSSNHHFSTSFVNFQGGRMTIQGKCRGQCEPQIFQKVYPSWGAMMQWHKLIEHVPLGLHMGVSKNRGTPKSSILIGFFSVNHPFWGTPIFGNTHIWVIKNEHLIFKRGSQLTWMPWWCSCLRWKERRFFGCWKFTPGRLKNDDWKTIPLKKGTNLVTLGGVCVYCFFFCSSSFSLAS